MVRWCSVNFLHRGVLLLWITVGQGPSALTVGAGGGCLDIFSLVYHFFFLSPSFWETARYRQILSQRAVKPKTTKPNQPIKGLAVGAGGGCLDIFSLVYHFSFLSPSLWETSRYRLKYCLKGPLSPKQPTNQPSKGRLT